MNLDYGFATFPYDILRKADGMMLCRLRDAKKANDFFEGDFPDIIRVGETEFVMRDKP